MRNLVIVSTVLLAITTSTASLAEPEKSGLFFDTVDVQVVNVEAVVVDKEGKPVLGLGPEDFEIFENGEPVEISNFFAAGSLNAADADPSMPLLAREDPMVKPETENLNLVVLVDNAHVSPQNRNQIFVNLRQFLKDRLKPDDQILIVSIGDSLEVETKFTRDEAVINATLDRLEAETGPSIRSYANISQLLLRIQSAKIPERETGFRDNLAEVERARLEAKDYASNIRALSEDRLNRSKATLQAMAGFVSSLAGMKGRKALLYISDGMSMNPADALMQAWQDKYLDWLSRNGYGRDQLELTTISSTSFSLTKELDQFVRHAASTKVAIYPISPGSRLSRSIGTAESRGSMTTSGSGGTSKLVGTLEQFALEESLLRMADETGGIAFTRSSNIEGLLEQIRDDFTTFYSLGYQPEILSTDRRDIEIKVKNKDWKIRYGKTIREKDPLDNLQDRILSAMYYDLEENPLRISLTPMKQEPTAGGNFNVSVMVQIPFEKILLLPEEAHHSGRLTLFVVVRDESNQRLSPFRHVEIPLQVPNEQILQVMAQSAGYPLELNIEPGLKRIAIGVRDRLAQLDATAHIDLEIGGSLDMTETHSP